MVSIKGGVHFDLVKRVLRDIQRSGQAPEEIIQQVVLASRTLAALFGACIVCRTAARRSSTVMRHVAMLALKSF